MENIYKAYIECFENNYRETYIVNLGYWRNPVNAWNELAEWADGYSKHHDVTEYIKNNKHYKIKDTFYAWFNNCESKDINKMVSCVKKGKVTYMKVEKNNSHNKYHFYVEEIKTED